MNSSVDAARRWTIPVAAAGTLEDVDVGAKARNLGQLIDLGLPVPAGFVVMTTAYREAMRCVDISADEVTEKHAGTIRQQLLAFEFPPNDEARVLSAYDNLPGRRDNICTVRSSASAEDSARASFAGLYDTYYGVERDELARRIRACWASVWTDQAVAYRRERGVPHRDVEMAVIVQQQIDARSAGVAFTTQ